MKTGLKLGIVALSLVAMATTIYTANVRAANTVKVQITWWANNCLQLQDYEWLNLSATASTIPLEAKSHDLKCTLLGSTGWAITISLWNLVGDTSSIENTNFMVAFWTTHQNGTLSWRNQTTPVAFGSGQTFYNKPANLVWELSWSVVLSGVVPAWQAIGTYQGELNISTPN